MRVSSFPVCRSVALRPTPRPRSCPCGADDFINVLAHCASPPQVASAAAAWDAAAWSVLSVAASPLTSWVFHDGSAWRTYGQIGDVESRCASNFFMGPVVKQKNNRICTEMWSPPSFVEYPV